MTDGARVFAPWDGDRAAALITPMIRMPGAALPILHALQGEFGYIHAEAIPIVAEALNLSKAEIVGVVNFYHDFRQSPPAAHELQVCRAEACQAMGSEALVARLAALLGAPIGERSADGRVDSRAVYCLGNCALSPAVMVDGTLRGRVTAANAESAIALSPALSEAADRLTGPPAKTVVWVPADAAARSVGADEVAAAIASSTAGLAVELRRNGSRGLFWLEPLVEVDTPAGRLAYGPVAVSDVAALFDAGFLDGGAHPLALGPVEAIPQLARQRRITFERCGVTVPHDLAGYEAHGGLAGLRAALALSPAAIIETVTASGLRGRGGAGFPAGIKWKTVQDAPATQKYIVCNADEGDSGTYADRMLMEGDPFALIEGMTIAGLATGADLGYVYVRSEYPDAFRSMVTAVEIARLAGWLGRDVFGSGRAFDIDIRLGAGAYICGEETALLESLEGKRGIIRPRPPLPAVKGLFGQPTVVNNVLTLATVPMILRDGPEGYAALGVGRSRGTIVLQLAGNVKRGGLVEVPFGLTLRELIEGFGGGAATGRPIRAVQVGGPLGAYFPADMLDLAIDYEAIAAAKGLLGHGGVVVFDDTVDMAQQARFALEFCAIESCGKCTPCRIGSTRGVEVIDRIIAGEGRTANLELLDDLLEVLQDGSLCGLGGLTPYPVKSALRHFPEDFDRPVPSRAPDNQPVSSRSPLEARP